MSDTDKPVVYVSPDGEHEMPLSSPAARLNWAARGWTPKTTKTSASPAPRTSSGSQTSAEK
jgi:hypothetical protein